MIAIFLLLLLLSSVFSLQILDTESSDVVCVSPRNHFIFTPMLPSSAVGSVEFRSLLDPIRSANPSVPYLEATCDRVDVVKKIAYCTSVAKNPDGVRPQFEIRYDTCVVAVGEVPGTFGTKGVMEYCYFMKEARDAVALRRRIGEVFDMACLPGTTKEMRRRLLSFVVVGGGPTGVEFAGTLEDFLQSDLRAKYPELAPYVSVTLIQSGSSVLTQFSAGLQEKAIAALRESGVSLKLGVRVVEVTADAVHVKSKDPTIGTGVEEVPYGVCVWSTGNAARSLTTQIIQGIGEEQLEWQTQRENNATWKLAVDPYMRIIGAEGIFAVGDNSLMVGNRLPATAQVAAQQGAYVARLINRGYKIGRGVVHETGSTADVFQPPVRPLGFDPFRPDRRERPAQVVYDSYDSASSDSETEEEEEEEEEEKGGRGRPPSPLLGVKVMSPADTQDDEAEELVRRARAVKLMSGNSPFGEVFLKNSRFLHGSSGQLDAQLAAEEEAKPFSFLSLGILAYVGNDKALSQLGPNEKESLQAAGAIGYLLWRSVYIVKQVSLRNRVLILFDWVKTKVFGRDLSMF